VLSFRLSGDLRELRWHSLDASIRARSQKWEAGCRTTLIQSFPGQRIKQISPPQKSLRQSSAKLPFAQAGIAANENPQALDILSPIDSIGAAGRGAQEGAPCHQVAINGRVATGRHVLIQKATEIVEQRWFDVGMIGYREQNHVTVDQCTQAAEFKANVIRSGWRGADWFE
jgi:hypothetical protein